MTKLIKGLLVAAMLTTGLMAKAQDIQIWTSDNKDGKITAASVEKAFADAGFIIDGNNNMNAAFKAKFKGTRHDLYHLFTTHRSENVAKLVKKYPSVGLFSPMSMSFFSRTGSKKFSVSSLSAAGWSKVTGIPADDKDLIAYSNLVIQVFKTAMPKGGFEHVSYNINEKKGPLVTTYTYEMNPDEDFIDQKEDFQAEIEGGLDAMGFVVAGFVEFAEEFAEAGDETYDIYDAYSICKLSVIYAVAEKRPEAGAYAPCTLYMHKAKGTNTLTMSFPSVYNWISSMDMDDANAIQILEDAQKDFEGILTEATE